MTPIVISYALELIAAGVVMFLLPHMSPQRFFFAVTVPPGFRTSSAGRAILRFYQGGVTLLWIASAALIAAGSQMNSPALFAIALAAPVLGSLGVFQMARRRTMPFAAPAETIHVAAMTASDDRLPRWFWLVLPAFALPLAAALYLRAHWSEIPERFPVHWGANGQPNGWSLKTLHGVFGPLEMSAVLMLVMIVLAVVTFYGARRAEQRTATLKVIVISIYFLALTFTSISLMAVMHLSILLFVIPAPLFAIGVIAWAFQFQNTPGRIAEATPDACWRLGAFYYNPDDPALFVQKRVGLGYTFNFGNRASWAILAVLVAAFVTLPILLR